MGEERTPDEMGEWSCRIQGLRIERDAWKLRALKAEAKLRAIANELRSVIDDSW